MSFNDLMPYHTLDDLTPKDIEALDILSEMATEDLGFEVTREAMIRGLEREYEHQLAVWCDEQRAAYRAGTLEPSHIALLEKESWWSWDDPDPEPESPANAVSLFGQHRAGKSQVAAAA